MILMSVVERIMDENIEVKHDYNSDDESPEVYAITENKMTNILRELKLPIMLFEERNQYYEIKKEER